MLTFVNHFFELFSYTYVFIYLVPESCSRILRYLIETFIIIHGETKLNMIRPTGGNPERRSGRPYHVTWCNNLNRRFATVPR